MSDDPASDHGHRPQIDLSGDVALVTGGTRGIGRAITHTLAAAGATVVPTSRTESDVQAAVEAVREAGGDSLAVTTDVAEPDSVAETVDRVVAEFSGLDILVNGAGINPISAMGRPEDLSPSAIERTLEVNLGGVFTCTSLAGEHLLEGGGAVVNVASTGGLVGIPRQHAYVSSKHGVVGFTRSFALDWAPTVRVNAVAPGYVRTEMTEGLREQDDLYESILDRTPMERFADPGEVASTVAFLASDMASFVTGECLVVDGGWTVE